MTYDDMGKMVCPCVPHDGREIIAICCYLLLVLGVLISVPLVLIGGLAVVHGVSVTIDDASLAAFALTTPKVNSTPPAALAVTYNLSMTIRVHNPNWFLPVHLAKPLNARYRFHGALFGHGWLSGQGGNKVPAGKTRVYHVATSAVGEAVPGLGVDGIAEFGRQRSAGLFEVDVVVAGHYTVRGAKRSVAATCVLKLTLGARPASSSEKVKCV